MTKKFSYMIRFVFILLLSCNLSDPPAYQSIWSSYFEGLGTYSSPKCIDLNNDNVLDIIIGAGKNEFEQSDSAVMAIDGRNGQLLWTVKGTDQMFGSANFSDLNNDGQPDVVINGRAAQLKAINGTSGKLLWEFKIAHNDFDPFGLMRFNFYNPQILGDVNKDGINDLLVSNGGNIAAYKKNGEDRYPGVLGIIDGANGTIIAADTMPDGQETYMSPVLYDENFSLKSKIVYGSGGETQGGHLYITTVSDLLENNISESKVICAKNTHGFIAPVTLSDLNQDGHFEIVSNWHGGEMMAYDLYNDKVLWQVNIPDTELNNSPAPGDATGDGIADFYSAFNKGAWPKNKESLHCLINGENGSILSIDTLGCAGFPTALSYDINNDGYDEFIYSINDYDCSGIYLANNEYSLWAYDYQNEKHIEIIEPIKVKNIASTPWLGDLDKNDELDIILSLQANSNDIYSYYGIQISRLKPDFQKSLKKHWTEYMGNDNRCIY